MLYATLMCFLVSQNVSVDSNGAHRVCVYQCGVEQYAMRVPMSRLCPLTTQED